jgi:hypothetical protein
VYPAGSRLVPAGTCRFGQASTGAVRDSPRRGPRGARGYAGRCRRHCETAIRFIMNIFTGSGCRERDVVRLERMRWKVPAAFFFSEIRTNASLAPAVADAHERRGFLS